jgi:perosamine synthetase
MKTIPVSGPWITEKEIEYVKDAVSSAWYNDANKYHDLFEKAFEKYLGIEHAVSLPSCTSAIHLSLLAIGVGPGDEVIVPDITWIATAAPISYVGATPVFADIDPLSWCISAESIERCITKRTKAVIIVDLYGGMTEWDKIKIVVDKHNLKVIEDSAEALGSEYFGKKAGTIGDIGVFSFHGSKTLTTGEGGMLVTKSAEIYNRVLFLRDHGRQPGNKMFWNIEVGYKYKMSSMQAALGLAQIERIEELIERKRSIFRWYKAQLENISGITYNYEPLGTTNTYWMVTVILSESSGIHKERAIELLKNFKIDCRPFFYPLSSLPAFRNLYSAQQAKKQNIYSYKISPYGINLPSGMNITEETANYVSQSLERIIS